MPNASLAPTIWEGTERRTIQLKSALQHQLESALADHHYRVLSNNIPEVTRTKYVELIAKAHKSIKIVAGEANHKLFNREDLAYALRKTLQDNPGSTVEMVFHKDDDFEKAETGFREENTFLLGLKREFPDRVHIFWTPKRPRQHYAVVDEGKLAILEQTSHPEHEPFWAVVTSNHDRGSSWARRFDNYVQHCRELGFESK